MTGLMMHAKIPGLKTDEVIVEAVNKHLNTNIRQVPTDHCNSSEKDTRAEHVQEDKKCNNIQRLYKRIQHFETTFQGSIGYDIAVVRMTYQRLKWDASALQRILHGDVSRARQMKTQGERTQ